MNKSDPVCTEQYIVDMSRTNKSLDLLKELVFTEQCYSLGRSTIIGDISNLTIAIDFNDRYVCDCMFNDNYVVVEQHKDKIDIDLEFYLRPDIYVALSYTKYDDRHSGYYKIDATEFLAELTKSLENELCEKRKCYELVKALKNESSVISVYCKKNQS